MRRQVFVGASAAATLPAALSAAVLISAPFAGTTTSPLAAEHPQAASTTAPAPASPGGMGAGDWALLGAAELVVLAGAAGTIALTRRRHLSSSRA